MPTVNAEGERGISIRLELNEDLVNNAVIEGLIETNLLRCMHGSPPVDLDPRVYLPHSVNLIITIYA